MGIRSLWVSLILLSGFHCLAANAVAPGHDDIALIRGVLEHYRTSWLANDPDGVRSCFTADAVLMPHQGLEPVVGIKAINEFWFAPTSSKTTVLKYSRTVDEIEVSASMAYARGHSEIEWRVEDKGVPERWRNHGDYLAILKKQQDGGWLITRLMWNDVPNQRL
jgi:uncharacterized protein (TIGR02246 family)